MTHILEFRKDVEDIAMWKYLTIKVSDHDEDYIPTQAEIDEKKRKAMLEEMGPEFVAWYEAKNAPPEDKVDPTMQDIEPLVKQEEDEKQPEEELKEPSVKAPSEHKSQMS